MLKLLKQLTCVREAEALTGSRGVAVELQPQAIGRTIDDVTHHAFTCKVAKETGWSVLSIIGLSIKTQEQDRRTWIKTWDKEGLCGVVQVYVVACQRARVHNSLLTWSGGEKKDGTKCGQSWNQNCRALLYCLCLTAATHSESPKYQTRQVRQKTSLRLWKKPLCLALHQCGPCEAPERQSLKYPMKVAEDRGELLRGYTTVSSADEASLFLC